MARVRFAEPDLRANAVIRLRGLNLWPHGPSGSLFGGSTSAAGGTRAECRDDLAGATRVRSEELNGNVVLGEGKRDLFGPLRPEPVGGAHRRDVDRLRVGTGGTPAAGALHDPAPEGDRADDPVDAERLCPRASLEIGRGLVGRPRRVDATAAAATGREVLGASAPREGKCTVEAARDKFVARGPERVVDDASKPEALALLHDEPGAPADDRLNVIGCCAHGAGTLSGSIGSSAGEGVAGDSAGSTGRSRGTGSSSGSTVNVRSGSPISTSSPTQAWAVSKCCACLDAPQADTRPPTGLKGKRA